MSDAFVVLGNPRTGSNHLISMLNSCAGIECSGELFHPHGVWGRNGTIDCDLGKRNADPTGFLDEQKDNAVGMFGFKIFMHHNDEVIDHVIQREDFKKIVLYRQNILAVFSSNEIAAVTNEYVISRKSDDRERVRVIFNASKFEAFREEYEIHYRNILRKLNHRNVSYELISYDALQSHPMVRRLFAFLSVEQPEKLSSATAKINANDIVGRFANQDEVQSYLSSRALEHWHYEAFVTI